MTNYTGGALTICPFYEGEGPARITCEGMAIGSKCTTKFPDANAKKRWQEAGCFTFDYETVCPIAGAASKRY